MKPNINSVDEYIINFPLEIQLKLNELRQLILEVASDAVESLAYGMPSYKLHGKPLVYFAGYKNHIGFYATPSGHLEFAEELSQYKQGKGSVQFPIDKPLPINLIRRIVEFRFCENLARLKK